jgi:hypothetical protein
MYNNILKAHHLTNLTVVFFGSSGFGKTSTVIDYTKSVGAKLIDKRTSTIEPLALFLPFLNKDTKEIDVYFTQWVNAMLHAESHTVIFLDEITNPSCPEVYSIMKELLGERTILGRPISKHIQFIGASNLSSEDTGVKDLPDSLMTRITKIDFAPTVTDVLAHMEPEEVRFFSQNTDLLAKPNIEENMQTPNPRQIRACTRLFKTGLLSFSELKMCFAGRIGKEAGLAYADFLASPRNQENELPQQITVNNLLYIKSFETAGRALEVTHFLKRDGLDRSAIALYLAEHAGAEVARNLHESKIELPRIEQSLNGKPAGMPWQIYAKSRNVLKFLKQKEEQTNDATHTA